MRTQNPMTYPQILQTLKSHYKPENIAGMARFGIVAKKAYGVPAPALRKLARQIGKDHALAQRLWASGIYDARLLAALIDDPTQVTEEQMESWVADFDNWAVCDGVCLHLFDRTPFAYPKAVEWSAREEEFVKRAGFALMAVLAVHDTKAPDAAFVRFLPIIERESDDDRNFVKKAVNWALRQIGKRNLALNGKAIAAAERIHKKDSRPARWIAADALRELRSEAVQKRLLAKSQRKV
ncbi:MAG: DNA alkylation repair protein [Armatimonadetes bacterium]|nr:DNA alkylation repair protein [Armatimonadota bacterium]